MYIYVYIYIYIYSKNNQILNFMKISLVGVQLIHAARGTEGQTDMTKIIIAFRNFANAPKMDLILHELRSD